VEIAVISDLHLGSGGRADRFGHEDRDFLRFLDFLERNHERIILLGDIWETVAGPTPGRPLAQLRACQKAHPLIADRFAGPKYTYIHGNHDLIARSALKAPEELVLRLDGERFLFTHGHRFDHLHRRARWLEELGIWAGGWLVRLGMSSLFRACEAADMLLRAASKDAARCPFQQWAMELAMRGDFDVVVTGHTHIAARAEHGARLFLNSGACTGRRFSFVHMNTRTKQYELVQEGGVR
jgi:UDP-2,3-diacylglucosamine pyrophosphatase LpxH